MKKWLSFLLVFVMLLSLVPAALASGEIEEAGEVTEEATEVITEEAPEEAAVEEAPAEEPVEEPEEAPATDGVETYPLWVGGVEVTSANASNILGDNTVRYDRATKTLTFSGLTGFANYYLRSSTLYGVYAEEDLTVTGTASFTVSGIYFATYGIASAGVLTIAPGADLTITTGNDGLEGRQGVIINGGKVNVTSQVGTGISARLQKSLVVNGGVVNTKGYSFGIDAQNSRIIVNGGTVIATARGKDYTGIRLLSGGSITVNGGVLDVTNTGGGKALDFSDHVSFASTHGITEGALDGSHFRIAPKAELIPGGVQTVGKVVHYGEVMECRLTGDAASIPASKVHYQWQISTDNKATWQDVPGATGASWTTPEDGEEVIVARVIVTADGYTGQLVSNAHAINVNSSKPTEITGGVIINGTVVYHGDTISCSLTGAAASIDTSKIHYQWQMSPDKTTWTNASGAVGASWLTPSGGSSVSYARVVVTADGYTGELVSDARALNVKSSSSTAISGSVTIRQTSEAETSFVLGKEIKGTYRNSAGVISTAPGLFYQWQRSANNANWEDIPGAATSAYTPTAADEGYWLRLVVTSKYSVGELYSGSKRVEPTPPAVKLSADGKSAQATNHTGLYARVALVLQNGSTSGLYVTQATINPDGTIVIPSFMVPGLTVKGVNIALVPTLADISSSTPNAKASDFKML